VKLINIIVFILLAFRKSIVYFGNNSPYFSRYVALFFIWLEEKGVIINTPDDNKESDHTGDDFSRWFYHLMTEDQARMNTYIKGIKKSAELYKTKGKVFMDIGCGDDLPLTRMVIEYAGAKKVRCIEANKLSFEVAK